MSPRELNEAIASHEGLVFHFLISHHINREDSRFYDLAQEMRLVIWHAVEAYDPARGVPFGPYAIVCMWRRFIQLGKKKKKCIEDNEAVASLDSKNDRGDDLLDTIMDDCRYEDVSDARLVAESVFCSSTALARPKAFEALRLVAEGRTYEEASLTLGCTKQNVGELVCSARTCVLATSRIARERG